MSISSTPISIMQCSRERIQRDDVSEIGACQTDGGQRLQLNASKRTGEYNLGAQSDHIGQPLNISQHPVTPHYEFKIRRKKISILGKWGKLRSVLRNATTPRPLPGSGPLWPGRPSYTDAGHPSSPAR
jgi:hypothetical protein